MESYRHRLFIVLMHIIKPIAFLSDGNWAICEQKQATISRYTVVCRAAQEAGAPHREYINMKKENAIFTPL